MGATGRGHGQRLLELVLLGGGQAAGRAENKSGVPVWLICIKPMPRCPTTLQPWTSIPVLVACSKRPGKAA